MKKDMLSKVRAYLALRRSFGVKLKGEGERLVEFGRYAKARGRIHLTNKLAISWSCQHKPADRVHCARRLEIIRPFARYLAAAEPQTQVPRGNLLGPAHPRRTPHLYSAEQIQLLLDRAGKLSGPLRAHTWQTLIGLLACSGLRTSEAIRLKPSDVDWSRSVLDIRESKGRTRMVPLHRSAVGPLRAYDQHRQKLFPIAKYFFVSDTGSRLSHSAHTFQKLRRGIPYTCRRPRLHDFRHTMASRVLAKWQSSGKTVANRVLILSRFLGHCRVESTYWYLSAFPQTLAEAAQRFGLDEKS